MARTTSPRRVRNALRVYLREHSGGSWWWVNVPGQGRKALGLDGSVSQPEAYRIACERFAAGAIAAGANGLPSEATIERLIELYGVERKGAYKPRSWGSIALHLFAWAEAMAAAGITRPSQITDAALSAWITERQKTADNATINRALVAVRVCLAWATERTPPLCAVTPMARRDNLTEIDRTPHPLIPSPAEWRRVVGELAAEPYAGRWQTAAQRERHAANARGVALLVAVAVQTGLRLDELRHLRAEDVHEGSVEVRAHGEWSPKGWAERSIPIPSGAADLARELVRWRDAAVGSSGKPIALGEHWINARLDAAWSRLGIAGDAPRMHDCRRTFATELVRAGQGLTIARERLGHRDVSTTERYLGRYRSDAAAVVPDFGVGSVLTAPAADVIPLRRGR